MRHEKANTVLQLARRLASSAEGMTLDEMAEEMGVGRRTAERMRDAIYSLFPQMEEVARDFRTRCQVKTQAKSMTGSAWIHASMQYSRLP